MKWKKTEKKKISSRRSKVFILCSWLSTVITYTSAAIRIRCRLHHIWQSASHNSSHSSRIIVVTKLRSIEGRQAKAYSNWRMKAKIDRFKTQSHRNIYTWWRHHCRSARDIQPNMTSKILNQEKLAETGRDKAHRKLSTIIRNNCHKWLSEILFGWIFRFGRLSIRTVYINTHNTQTYTHMMV